MEEYKHPVFFEAKHLTDREKQKIRRHFQKKRVSGGGECGMIEKAGGNIYKYCFMEEEDQERVLQRKCHTISFPCRELYQTMSQTSLLHNPTHTDQPSTSRSQPNFQKECPVVEKQFKLVDKGLTRKMCADYPDVKIPRGNTYTIILEGLDRDIKSGATKPVMKSVKEKRLKLPTDLITFIKSSCAVSKYRTRFQQSLRNPVSLEVGSGLVLSSLSSDAVDEAWETMKTDLSVETVKLQGAAAVPPDLDRVKEILIKAKNEENCREFRVNVSFIPGNSGTPEIKVRMVGYSENVTKLKEVLHDYQMNQAEIQEVLNLPHPELVDCFDKILNLIGMKQTKVTFKALNSPCPCVHLSGPRCHVQEVKEALTSALASLTLDRLVLDGPGAQRYFQGEGKVGKDLVESSCQVLIREQQDVFSPDVKIKSQSFSSPSPNPSPCVTPRPSIARWRSHNFGNIVVNKTSLRIKLGGLEDEQVNVLVIPMLKRQLASTKIGKRLLSKAGNRIMLNFALMAAKCTLNPGDVLQIDGSPSLGCSKLFFIECSPWDGVRGQSVQALSNGLKKCLDLCVQQGLSSVAFPVIGPGIVLKYPLREAVQVLTENIHQFGLSASSGSLSTIHVVIKPGYPDSEECYHDVYRHLSLSLNQGGQVIFRPLTSDLDEVTITVGGGVKLQLVFGDISNETTDVVVNTTNFVHLYRDGVCKDILTKAGPQVEALLKNAKVRRGELFKTQPGSFPCKAILHLYGENDAGVVEQLVCRIIQHCETFGYKSVAIPAICAGGGGLDPGVVARAILRGVNTATSSTSLHSLTNIRLVLIKIEVFLAFKHRASQVFPCAEINTVSVLQMPDIPQQQSTASVNADQSILPTSSSGQQQQQSVFMFFGLCKKNVEDAMTKLKNLYQAQYPTQTFTKDDLQGLTQEDMNNLSKLVEILGLFMQKDQSGPGSLTMSGLKDRVNQVMQIIQTIGPLRREARVREEEDLYSRVVWCILVQGGKWERLPKTVSHNLENGNVLRGIVDAHNVLWRVDLQRMEATRSLTGQTAKLKRLETLPDLTVPLYWDNMMEIENLKVVELQASSAEYWTVEKAFKRTVTMTIIKIERLQNVHLLRAYEVQKKHISDKNGQKGAGEKLLYHGTTQDNCDSIMRAGFNRSFAGQNATSYGPGTYFAVKASYSAKPTYSKPAADGSQFMFMARVLTGAYTQGYKGMKVPPPLNDLQPHDRYDSVVDRIDNPSMYIVFHDNQAYPDYLITFKSL
ncbi:protein mono-ADP-ribosyltransferase PARP14-like [Trachinotus anak]|uniref:protein mono-ADP-ribosyltransferase PARP14-like n=1 Tax=Trachinotus anak TaxID=443729 RepID=UPI0039F21F44